MREKDPWRIVQYMTGIMSVPKNTDKSRIMAGFSPAKRMTK
jgi:hypothetical protein